MACGYRKYCGCCRYTLSPFMNCRINDRIDFCFGTASDDTAPVSLPGLAGRKDGRVSHPATPQSVSMAPSPGTGSMNSYPGDNDSNSVDGMPPGPPPPMGAPPNWNKMSSPVSHVLFSVFHPKFSLVLFIIHFITKGRGFSFFGVDLGSRFAVAWWFIVCPLAFSSLFFSNRSTMLCLLLLTKSSNQRLILFTFWVFIF